VGAPYEQPAHGDRVGHVQQQKGWRAEGVCVLRASQSTLMNSVHLQPAATAGDKQLLVCEICQKSFEDTKMLVRHLGTHAGDPAGGTDRNLLPSSASGSTATASSNLALRTVKTYVPKKRRRVSVSC